MKIRWTHNSIRFRITPSELQSLQNGETVSEQFSLAGSAVWSTRIAPGNDCTRLEFASGVLCLHLGAADLAQLLLPDAEGVYFSSPDFRYFVEKDFPCAHPRASEAEEIQPETFAAPCGFEERKNSSI